MRAADRFTYPKASLKAFFSTVGGSPMVNVPRSFTVYWGVMRPVSRPAMEVTSLNVDAGA